MWRAVEGCGREKVLPSDMWKEGVPEGWVPEVAGR